MFEIRAQFDIEVEVFLLMMVGITLPSTIPPPFCILLNVHYASILQIDISGIGITTHKTHARDAFPIVSDKGFKGTWGSKVHLYQTTETDSDTLDNWTGTALIY